LVTLEQGLVQADAADLPRTCALDRSSVAASIERQRDVSLLGLPPARYRADTEEVSTGEAELHLFELEVPPGVYDVYVEPDVPAECVLEALPPFFFRAQTLDRDATLSVVLPPTRSLFGTLQLPRGASVDGWLVELVEPYGGQRVSSVATLSQAEWAENAEFQLRYSWTFPAPPVIRLRPPEGGKGPTVHWDLATADLDGDGVVGEQPILAPGETFSYTSGCPLSTPSGIMVGAYRFVDEDGESFDVSIPAFSLDSPQGARTLN
jgi:hypothetical protein